MAQIITPAELEHLSIAELRCLLRQVWKDLARLKQDSPEGRLALALIENIERALYGRLLHWPRA